jgi:2-polyprenyl-3-methyl-5-hydroxy-6-metoxy-1,4-benzoquinol methylase
MVTGQVEEFRMVVRIDPENNETRALFDLVNLVGRSVLEIGSGDGRLTWRYAGVTKRVTAIEPFSDGIRKAQENLPETLRSRVEFRNVSFEEFASDGKPTNFDVVILSWSL